MNPLLTFSAGILAGVATIRWLKNEKMQHSAEAVEKAVRETVAAGCEKTASGLESAQAKLRSAAIAGLEAVERSSVQLRTRLTPANEVAVLEAAAVAGTTKPPAAKRTARASTKDDGQPARKGAPRRKTAPRAKKTDTAAS